MKHIKEFNFTQQKIKVIIHGRGEDLEISGADANGELYLTSEEAKEFSRHLFNNFGTYDWI